MKYKVIRSEQLPSENFGVIEVQNLLLSRTISIAKVSLNGKNKRSLNNTSDSYYFVLEGRGTFSIKTEIIEVKKGDLIYIPKKTEYFDSGEMRLLVINNPPFNRDNVEFLK